MKPWRVGQKVPLNVYEGDRPICQCHTELDAHNIVASMNGDPLDTSDREVIGWFAVGLIIGMIFTFWVTR